MLATISGQSTNGTICLQQSVTLPAHNASMNHFSDTILLGRRHEDVPVVLKQLGYDMWDNQAISEVTWRNQMKSLSFSYQDPFSS